MNTRVVEEYLNIPVMHVVSGQLRLKVRKSKKSLVEALLEEQKRNS